MIRLALATLFALFMPLSAMAEGRATLGWGRLLTNDLLGDLQDRWHSGSYTVSLIRGPVWTGRLPEDLGALLEYRISGRTMTAANLAHPAADDRRHAAPLSLGLHSHARWRGFDASLGADLVATGPQSGVGRFQTWLHGLLDAPRPDLTAQLGNAFFPTARAELGRDIALSGRMTLHPFVAATAGAEHLVRAGGDVVIGNFGQGALLLRDETTGQRYRAVAGPSPAALSFTLGGDVAHVFGSAYLPQGGAATALHTRARLRAGVAWQGERSSAFYGVTYLSPDFASQPSGQVVGSVTLNLRF